MSRRSPMLGEAGYVRLANDAYVTPDWITETLVERVPLRAPVWEPACGTGKMAEVLAKRYLTITSDLRNYGYKRSVVYDFLDDPQPPPQPAWGTICTNPPYQDAEEFVRTALDFTEDDGMVCMLLRNEFDCAKSRLDLFRHPAFALKLVLTKRPRWFEHEKASPRFHFAWFIWDWTHKGPPILEYA